MPVVVGEAEVVIHANTAGFQKELASSTDPAFSKLTTEAETAGEDAGNALSGGVKKTTNLDDHLKQEGEKGGKSLKKGLEGPISGISNLLGNLGLPEALTSPEALGVEAIAAAGAGAAMLAVGMQKADIAIANTEGISIKAATNIGKAFLGTAGLTEFSAKEQAEAFATVSGQLKSTEGHALSTADSMTFMGAAMDLATAKQIPLGTATATVAGVMQAFQLKVKDTAHVTDVLFNASNATGQGIDAVGSSLERLKSKLGSTAPPIGDLAGLLVSMTQNGITGRAAISGVNAAMTGLQGAAEGSTKAGVKAKETLAEFGLSAVNSQGQITPLTTIIAGLAPHFQKMTQAQQLASAATIFGAGAARQMTAVIDAGATAFDKTTAAVNKHDAAQKAAQAQSQNFSVRMKTLEAELEDFGTTIGQFLLPLLKDLASAFMDVIDVVVQATKFIFQHKDLLVAIGVVLAAVIIPALIDMAASLAVATASFVAEGIAAAAAWAATLGPIDLIIAAIALVAGAVYEIIQHWSAIASFFVGLWHSITSVFDSAIKFIKSIFEDVIHWISSHWQLLVAILAGPIGIIVLLIYKFRGTIAKVFDAIVHDISHAWDDLLNGAEDVVMGIYNFFASLPGKIVHAIESGAKDVLKAFESLIPGGGVIGGALNAIGLATGGIVTKPTLAVVGEAGPEAVIPLKGFGTAANAVIGGGGVNPLPTGSLNSSSGGSQGHGEIHIHVTTTAQSPAQIASEISWLAKTGQLQGAA